MQTTVPATHPIRIDLEVPDLLHERALEISSFYFHVFPGRIEWIADYSMEWIEDESDMVWKSGRKYFKSTYFRSTFTGVDVIFNHKNGLWKVILSMPGDDYALETFFTKRKPAEALYATLHKWLFGSPD